MTSVTTLPASGEWTVDDLDRLPDDGLRHELVDGVLLVSPAPLVPHQLAVSQLLQELGRAAPAQLRVLPAPLDVTFGRTRLLQPDLVVVHRDQLTTRRVTGVPLLVVEVLSASTRATDLTLKRHVYEQAGVPSYWLVEPEAAVLTALELADGRYREAAVVQGDEAFRAGQPFPVDVVPGELLR